MQREVPFVVDEVPGVFHMKIQPVSKQLSRTLATIKGSVLGRSDFGWIGPSYKPIASTRTLWKHLQTFIFIMSVPVDPMGALPFDAFGHPRKMDPTPDTVANDRSWVALPGALAEIRSGVPWNSNR